MHKKHHAPEDLVLSLTDLGFQHATLLGTLPSLETGQEEPCIVHVWLRCMAGTGDNADGSLQQLSGYGVIEVMNPSHRHTGCYEAPPLDLDGLSLRVATYSGERYPLTLTQGADAQFRATGSAKGMDESREARLREMLPFRVDGEADLFDGAFLEAAGWDKWVALGADMCSAGPVKRFGRPAAVAEMASRATLNDTVNVIPVPLFWGSLREHSPMRMLGLLHHHINYHSAHLALTHTVAVIQRPELTALQAIPQFHQLMRSHLFSVVLWEDVAQLAEPEAKYDFQVLLGNLLSLYISAGPQRMIMIDADEYLVAHDGDFTSFDNALASADVVELFRVDTSTHMDGKYKGLQEQDGSAPIGTTDMVDTKGVQPKMMAVRPSKVLFSHVHALALRTPSAAGTVFSKDHDVYLLHFTNLFSKRRNFHKQSKVGDHPRIEHIKDFLGDAGPDVASLCALCPA